MLDLEQLRDRCANGESFEYLFFWGHQESKTGKVTKSCLSQWFPAGFQLDGEHYLTAEHWMMASKARLFDDSKSLKLILEAPDPKSAKALGRKVKDFDNYVWNANSRRIVTEGNVAKFGQNPELRKFLVDTGEQILVEASPYDRVWGIGLKATDKKSAHPSTWQGQNLLGFALMDVRERLAQT